MALRRFYLSDGRTKAFAWLYLYRDRLSRLAVLSRLDHFYLIQTHRSIVHARFYNQAELGVLVEPSKSSKVTSPLCHVPPCAAAGRVRTKAVVPEPPGLVTCRVTLSGTLAAVLASLPKFTYLNFTIALARGTTFCISFTYKRLSLGAVCIA